MIYMYVFKLGVKSVCVCVCVCVGGGVTRIFIRRRKEKG